VKEILELIATYGLPIVLTCWFVFRIDTMLTNLSGSLTTFIEWLKQKEMDRKEREDSVRKAISDLDKDHLTILKDQMATVINKISILEVKIERPK